VKIVRNPNIHDKIRKDLHPVFKELNKKPIAEKIRISARMFVK